MRPCEGTTKEFYLNDHTAGFYLHCSSNTERVSHMRMNR